MKPQGFRKSGSCFRRELENGIVWEVEIQKSQFNMPSQGWSQFTINVKAGLFPEPVSPLSWKRNHPQLCGNLGTKADRGWKHQHWYHVLDPADPRRKDGAWSLICQEPGKDWQEKKIPCPIPDEIIKEVCGLLIEKVVSFYQSLQTLEEYLEKAIENARWKESQDMSQYDELLQQYHKKSVEEVEMQDVHQTIMIAVAAIAAHQAQADSMEEEILRFVERSTEAEIVELETEIR